MTALARWIGRLLARVGNRLCREPLDISTPDGVRVCVCESLTGPAEVKVLLLAQMPDGAVLSFGLPAERARQLYRSLREAATLAGTLSS